MNFQWCNLWFVNEHNLFSLILRGFQIWKKKIIVGFWLTEFWARPGSLHFPKMSQVIPMSHQVEAPHSEERGIGHVGVFMTHPIPSLPSRHGRYKWSASKSKPFQYGPRSWMWWRVHCRTRWACVHESIQVKVTGRELDEQVWSPGGVLLKMVPETLADRCKVSPGGEHSDGGEKAEWRQTWGWSCICGSGH